MAVSSDLSRVVSSRDLYLVSSNASNGTLLHFLGNQMFDRTDALVEIDRCIPPTKGDPPYIKFEPDGSFLGITAEMDIESLFHETPPKKTRRVKTKVRVWRMPKWSESRYRFQGRKGKSFFPNLISVTHPRHKDEEDVVAYLFYTPVKVTCPRSFPGAYEDELSNLIEFNRVQIATAQKISELYRTPITWNRALLNPNNPVRKHAKIERPIILPQDTCDNPTCQYLPRTIKELAVSVLAIGGHLAELDDRGDATEISAEGYTMPTGPSLLQSHRSQAASDAAIGTGFEEIEDPTIVLESDDSDEGAEAK